MTNCAPIMPPSEKVAFCLIFAFFPSVLASMSSNIFWHDAGSILESEVLSGSFLVAAHPVGMSLTASKPDLACAAVSPSPAPLGLGAGELSCGAGPAGCVPTVAARSGVPPQPDNRIPTAINGMAATA